MRNGAVATSSEGSRYRPSSANPAHPRSPDQALGSITEIATPQPESGDQSEAGSALASRRPIGRPPIASELVPGLTANSSKPLS